MLKETLIRTTKEAGKNILDHFGTAFSISQKTSANNIVTEVDKSTERLIRKMINDQFPDHGIVGEEYEIQQTKTKYQWIVDPIDGTTNFAHGIPLCCVSIGLLEDEKMLMGAVYNPMMDEFYFAERGKGAFVNEQRISVSDSSDFDTACLVTGFPYNFPDYDITRVFTKLVKKGLPVRRLGSAALDLCWVACGRFDGFWEHNLNAWDIAAGYLIVEEAGGRVTDFQDNPYTVWDKQTLATNGKIHEELRQAIIAEMDQA